MKLRVTILFPFAILIFLLLMEGCSSSSNSTRYNERTKENRSNSGFVRFTSADDDTVITRKQNLPNSGRHFTNDEDNLDPAHTNSIIKPSALLSRFGNESNTINHDRQDSSLKDKMLNEIIKFLNTPYKYGGESKLGIDCSAFTQTLYSDVLDIPLFRTAREQFTEGAAVRNENDLKFGDLVFFDTRRTSVPGHVGIYIGDGLFAHASSSFGVIVSSLSDEYYANRYMGARRIEHFASLNRF